MKAPTNERGAALLSVLLLVAVMAAIAATALDRIGISTRLAANAATVVQGRAWLESAELLATTRLEDMIAANPNKTMAAGWMGLDRSIALPDGGVVQARVEDGGNCFNLNSLAQRMADGTLVYRPQAINQFMALMVLLGIAEGEAARIANSAADFVDTDSLPLILGAEDGGTILPANRMMADPSELRLVAGVTDRHYGLLSRWICALPTSEPTGINVNTLLPEQAPLVAMLLPGKLDVASARAALAARPSGGFDTGAQFWQSPAFAGLETYEAADQAKVNTSFFVLNARVQSSDIDVRETALIDARAKPARVVRRSWANVG